MKTFVNTTLGLTFREKLEKTDIDLLIERARSSTYTKCIVPFGCVLLLCGLDTQNDRIEAVVWGYGRGMQMWCIDHQVFWGDPEQDAVWIEVEEYLFTKKFNHASGAQISVQASAIDTGGQRTQAVYAFVDRHQDKKIFAVKGYSGRETHIKQSASLVEIDWRGKKIKSGLKLWMVGTNLAKDQIYGRLQIPTPGSGYVNFYNSPTEEFFKQMAGENRVERAVLGGTESRWTANRKRVEAWDCTTYAIWLEVHLGLGKKFPSYWDAMENEVQPVILDLFSQPPAKQGTGHIESSTPALIDVAEVKEEKSLNRLITNDFVPDEWADRGWT